MTTANLNNQPNVNNSSVALAAQPSEMGVREMSSLEIADITGKQHAHVMRDIRTLIEQGVNESNFGLVDYTDKKGEKRSMYNLTKKGCLILASGYNAVLREKIIDRWESLETGQAVPMYQAIQQPVQPQPLNPLTLTDMTSWVKDLKDILRLNDASTLELLQDVSNQYGGLLPVPKYTKSKGEAKAASTLFEKRGYGKKSRTLTSKLNEVLLNYGILTKIPRKKSDGSADYFWSITDEGSPYGENDIPRGFKKKTQPLWYVDKFDEMLSLVNFNPEDYIKR